MAQRGSVSATASRMGTARTEPSPGCEAARPDAGSRRSSTNEFHSPQSGQRPSHFGETAPQDWQAKTVAGRGEGATS